MKYVINALVKACDSCTSQELYKGVSNMKKLIQIIRKYHLNTDGINTRLNLAIGYLGAGISNKHIKKYSTEDILKLLREIEEIEGAGTDV